MLSFQIVSSRYFAVLVLSLVSFLVGCQTSTEDLNRYIQNGEIKKVSQFASINISSDDSDLRVVHAIRLLSDAQADTALVSLAALVSRSSPPEHVEALVVGLHERQIERSRGFHLCKMAVEGNLPPGDATAVYLSHQGSRKLMECVASHVSASGATVNPERMVSAIENLEGLTNVENDVRTIKLTAEALNEVRTSLEEVRRKVLDLKNEEKDVSEHLSQIRGELDDIQVLTAFVIGLQERTRDGELYEIAFLDRWGRPSPKRAHLFAKKTQFSTKGRFTMPVIRRTNVDTRLRDKYGGFRQSWPFFVEATTEYDIFRTLLDMTVEEDRKLNDDLEASLGEEQRLVSEEGQLKRDLERQISSITDNSDFAEGESGVPARIRVDSRLLPVAGVVSSDGGKALYLVRDEQEGVWRLIEAGSNIHLGATFSFDTAVGPFHWAKVRDGIYFQTADDRWFTYHYWNPGDGLHVWKARSRLSNRTGESSNIESYPNIASQLKRRPDLDLDYLEKEEYFKARRVILTSGWVPLAGENDSFSSVERSMMDRGWTEIQQCAGTGLNPCRFEFVRPSGSRLVVITEGEGDARVRSIFVRG